MRRLNIAELLINDGQVNMSTTINQFLQKKIANVKQQLTDIEEELQNLEPSTPLKGGFDTRLLLTSEKYRIQVAIEITKNNLEAKELLNMNERTFYRRVKKYKLK